MSPKQQLVAPTKSDTLVVFDAPASSMKPLSVEAMIERIETLDKQDVVAGGQLLKNAIERGQLLRSIKEQSQHGAWLFHLKTLNLHPRYAQRLMSLAEWKGVLIAENRNNVAQKKRPLSVAEALKLVSRWNSRPQRTAQDDTADPVEAVDPFGIKTKGQHLIITWTVPLADLDTIIERIERQPRQLTTQILAMLRDHTGSQTDAKSH